MNTIQMKIKRLIITLSSLFALLFILGSASILGVTFYFSKDLPDYRQLKNYDPPTTTRFYTADGKLLQEYATERRQFVPIHAIPNRIKNAFIAAEDKNFYDHPGIDFLSILRAAGKNLMNVGRGKPLVGGSTITQQVVKNFLLTKEQSITRKVKEAILSFRITQAFSKERILELYLNDIYLGAGSYGVAAAALNYFNKSIDELAIEEAALLAGLPKAPGRDDPKRNYNGALKRRNYVIKRMYEDKHITHEEYQHALATPITLRKRDKTQRLYAPYFAEAVRLELIETFDEKELYEGGLFIRTTINPKLQQYAESALQHGLISYDRRHGYRNHIAHINLPHPSTNTTPSHWKTKLNNIPDPQHLNSWHTAVVLEYNNTNTIIGLKDGTTGTIPFKHIKWARAYIHDNARGPAIKHPSDLLKRGDVIVVSKLDKANTYALKQIPEINGALIALDPHTGKILAMMGGYSNEDNQFNRATQANRQPGSAFKTFAYLAALEKGFSPTSIIVDAEIEFDQGDNLPTWSPQNYSGDYYGPSTLRLGLERSRNAMSVRLAQLLGLEHIIEICKRFKINLNPNNNFSIVLGTAETTLLNISTAYAMLVNGGKKITPTLVERIQNKDGKTIRKRDIRPCINCNITSLNTPPPIIKDIRKNITDPHSAYQITSILEGVIKRGTGMKARSLNKTLGGKTGTTNKSIDNWFIGFSPDLVVGVYVGFDKPRSLGKRETGASVALPIFINFMKKALKNKPDIPFRIPTGIQLVRIDKTNGQLPTPNTPTKDIILEAFKPGQTPTQNTHHKKTKTKNINTGGLY